MCTNQVTNPAIDPLREGLVMSLEVNLGKRGNILEVGPENASQVPIYFRNSMNNRTQQVSCFLVSYYSLCNLKFLYSSFSDYFVLGK